MGIKKIKTIANAFLSPLPVGEEWYEKRVATCNDCEMNSKNISDPTFMQQVETKAKSLVCDDGNHCTACGCCVLRKCAVKASICGMVELETPRTPKWKAIETESFAGISLEVVGGEYFATAGVKEILFDFGASSENVVKAEFILKSVSDFTFSKTTVSCGCTHVEKVTPINKRNITFNVSMSTLGFRTGLNEKLLTVEYRTAMGGYKTVTIRFRLIKL